MRVEGGTMASRAGMGMAGLGMGLAGGHRTPRISMDILEKGSTQKKNHKASKVTKHYLTRMLACIIMHHSSFILLYQLQYLKH